MRKVNSELSRFNPSQGDIDIFRLKAGHDLVHPHVQGLKPYGIDPDVDFPFGGTDQFHLSDTGDIFKTAFDLFFHQGGQVSGRQFFGSHGQGDNRHGSNINFIDNRFFDILREIPADGVDLGPGILRGLIDLDLQLKLDHHLGDAFPGNGHDMFDPGDAVDHLFNPFGHFPFHRLRRGPGKDGDNGKDRDFHIRIHIDGQAFGRKISPE